MFQSRPHRFISTPVTSSDSSQHLHQCGPHLDTLHHTEDALLSMHFSTTSSSTSFMFPVARSGCNQDGLSPPISAGCITSRWAHMTLQSSGRCHDSKMASAPPSFPQSTGWVSHPGHRLFNLSPLVGTTESFLSTDH